MQQYGEPQQHDEIQGVAIPRRDELLDTLQRQLTSMSADHPGENTLLFTRKSRHICVFQQVRTMAVITAVGYVETDFVQARSPLQRQLRERSFEPPGFTRL